MVSRAISKAAHGGIEKHQNLAGWNQQIWNGALRSVGITKYHKQRWRVYICLPGCLRVIELLSLTCLASFPAAAQRCHLIPGVEDTWG